MEGAAQWDALDRLFQEADDATQPLQQPKTSYGADAPVAVKGMTPGMIGPPKKALAAKPKAKKPVDGNEIWDAATVDDEPDEIDDGRPQPEYEIIYKQAVSPQDMFLGVDFTRHPGISCSDALVLQVTLPATKLADIELDVRTTYVRVQAPKFKLKAWLPEKVDENKGNAKWDGDKERLLVTLPIVRDDMAKMSVSDELD